MRGASRGQAVPSPTGTAPCMATYLMLFLAESSRARTSAGTAASGVHAHLAQSRSRRPKVRCFSCAILAAAGTTTCTRLRARDTPVSCSIDQALFPISACPDLGPVERYRCQTLQSIEGIIVVKSTSPDRRASSSVASANGRPASSSRSAGSESSRPSGGENRYLPRIHVVFHESLLEGHQHGNRLLIARAGVELFGFRPVRCSRVQ